MIHLRLAHFIFQFLNSRNSTISELDFVGFGIEFRSIAAFFRALQATLVGFQKDGESKSVVPCPGQI